ncbi:TetR family transcriptional regulator [Tamaricihabitans halophyticus]|uniref:TetR family transcriptional regulator n=1 Tax=Tamaricihabitans halophyticus TaxID=1262583 RepID=A0A4R2R6J4_9PSEU|nr:TetR/AcrR family transcriptional regulator [Tamaricihabitans halophyticus]TCP57489.1 TetR family transcriptional regulator [Tamaricihabitans halophyticus]
MVGKRLSRTARRELILDAAAEAFGGAGYAGTGMRDVAARAGVSAPVLYDHFPTKAELYAVLLDRQVNALIEDWAPPPRQLDTFELFRGTVDAIFSWIERNEAAWRMIFGEAPSEQVVAEAHRRGQERATRQLAGLFRQVPHLALSVDLDRDRADEVLAEAAKSALNAIATWWWRNRDIPRVHVVAITADLLWRGLRELTDSELTDSKGKPG